MKASWIRLFLALLTSLVFATAAFSAQHTVRKGETLSKIAEMYGVSVSEIRSNNNISDANVIKIGQTLEIPDPKGSYVAYKARRGDSLSSIAKRYGVSVERLAALNGIGNANKIAVGQVIKVPRPQVHAGAKLPSSVKRSLGRIETKRSWKNIVIHHSATPTGRAQNMDRVHREERRMENGLAYHFVIGNGRGMRDGEIYIGNRWRKQLHGGHLRSPQQNAVSIGICLVGNFEKTMPTNKQMERLEALTLYLMRVATIPESNVTTHKLIHPKHTLCPGEKFPVSAFKSRLRAAQ